MDKKTIQKAIDAAEQEHQEKEIEKIKKIVQSYLEKIEDMVEKRKELDKKISLLKKDLDDLKAGRLDKILERQEKDDDAREISLIIVKKIEKEYIPMAPWRSPWIVEWRANWNYNPLNSQVLCTNSISNASCTINTTSTNGSGYTLTSTGNGIANFVSGTYHVGDRTINL